MRGNESSVETGIQPSWSQLVSYKKRSDARRFSSRYHSTCEQIFSASVLRRTSDAELDGLLTTSSSELDSIASGMESRDTRFESTSCCTAA